MLKRDKDPLIPQKTLHTLLKMLSTKLKVTVKQKYIIECQKLLFTIEYQEEKLQLTLLGRAIHKFYHRKLKTKFQSV